MSINTNCEWRAFGEIDLNVRKKIETLKPKYESGALFTDEYIWCPGCTVNVKLRKGKLKFKQLINRTHDGLDVMAVIDKVNIDLDGITKLEKQLKTTAPRELKTSPITQHDLINALSSFNPPLVRIEVTKFRRQYLRELNDQTISVELAEIRGPVQTGSICIECEDIDQSNVDPSIYNKIRTVRDELGLPGNMKVRSYLDALESWVRKPN